MANSTDATQCNPGQLKRLLSEELSDAEENAALRHLSNCHSCRQLMDQVAAAGDAWRDAQGFLPDKSDDLFFLGSDADCEPESATSALIQSVIEALDPTDDSEMLGRIGNHEVSGVIGAGGMGVVVKAIDKSLDRVVAIKILAPHLASSGAARQRFAREAKAAAAVLHPNVIAIHGVCVQSKLPFLVMPYITGQSLQQRLDENGPLSVDEILRIGQQIAAGLAAAHAQGLVHRDIKPANVLLERGVERVTITDFGLARAIDDASMTRTGVITGTPQFMSPEQACGESIDDRSDLFSLGSVMYAMCTARPPFRAETSYGVLRRITDDEARPVCQINQSIPSWLGRLVDLLHAKSCDDRIESAEVLDRILQQCIAHREQPATQPLPSVLKASPAQQRSRRLLGRMGLAMPLVLTSIFAFMQILGGKPNQQVAQESIQHDSTPQNSQIPLDDEANQDVDSETTTNEPENRHAIHHGTEPKHDSVLEFSWKPENAIALDEDDAERWDLTLKDCVSIALQNSEFLLSSHDGPVFELQHGARNAAGRKATRPAALTKLIVHAVDPDMTLQDLEKHVAHLVREVEIAYWDLYLSYRDVANGVKLRDSAREVARISAAHLESGTGTRQELAQAQEQYHGAEAQLKIALHGSNLTPNVVGLYDRERALRKILGLSVEDGRLLHPMDHPFLKSPAGDQSFDFNKLSDEMLATRTDLKSIQLRIKSQELELTTAKNQIKPTMHLSELYRLQGTDGRAESKESWSAFVESLPLGSRREAARIRNAQLRLARTKAYFKECERLLSQQLAEAVNETQSLKGAAINHKNRLHVAYEEVDARFKEFERGLSNVNVVLQSQQRRAEAEHEFHDALAEFRKSTNYISYISGTLLAENDVSISKRN